MYSKVGAKDADLLVIGKRKISRKRKLFICVLFVATVLTGMSVFEKMNAPAPLPVDTSVKIVATMPKPESGAPTDYSAYENFCIAAGVLNDASYFRADTDGTIIASVFGAPYNQKLEGHRVQKDGRLFHEVNSTSTMKSVGEQRFFADDAILMRTAKYKKGVPNLGSIIRNYPPRNLPLRCKRRHCSRIGVCFGRQRTYDLLYGARPRYRARTL